MQFMFGDCVLDPGRRELTRGSQVIAVGPQVFDLLIYLVRNRERVVSKDDVLDAVWSGRTVSESTLTSHINAARKAIGDSGEEQRLIRTVARKGFRFVGGVSEVQSSDGDFLQNCFERRPMKRGCKGARRRSAAGQSGRKRPTRAPDGDTAHPLLAR